MPSTSRTRIRSTRPEDALARNDRTARHLLRDGARSIRVIGELPGFETEEQWNAWILYDALLNHAFTHLPVRVACAYDERVTPEPVLEASRRTHPQIHHGDWRGGRWDESPDFDPTGMARAMTPDPAPLPGLREVPAGESSRAFRERLAGELAAADVAADAAEGMLVGAAEIYVNAVRHGGGAPALRVGRVDGRFVCELSDRGGGLDDPLAGSRPPREGATGGAGMWIARQLASRLELLPTPGGGLTARLWT